MWLCKVLGLWIILGICIAIAFGILLGNSLRYHTRAVADGNMTDVHHLSRCLIQPKKRVPTLYHQKASAQIASRGSKSCRCDELTDKIADVQKVVGMLMDEMQCLNGNSNDTRTEAWAMSAEPTLSWQGRGSGVISGSLHQRNMSIVDLEDSARGSDF